MSTPQGGRQTRRILFLHPSDEAYGADRMLLQEATGLQDRGWSVRVGLADDSGPGWLSERLRDAGIPFVRLPLAPARRRYLVPMRLPAYLRDLMRARRVIRREAIRFMPDVIHVNTSALLVGAILGRPAGARLVWHVHEIIVRPRAAVWLFRSAPMLTADRVIAISSAVERHLAVGILRFRRSRLVVAANGIPDRPVVRPPAGRVKVLYIGRLNRWKGYEDVVTAAGLTDADARAEFLIAGTAPDGEQWRESQLSDRIDRSDLGPRLKWLGYVEDGPSLIDQVDIVVVPSRWPEPFGLVTLEAMRASRPVIATDHGASPELLDRGQAGLLVPPADPVALASAIDRLVRDADSRIALGRAGRDRFLGSYTLVRHLDALEGIYEDVRA